MTIDTKELAKEIVQQQREAERIEKEARVREENIHISRIEAAENAARWKRTKMTILAVLVTGVIAFAHLFYQSCSPNSSENIERRLREAVNRLVSEETGVSAGWLHIGLSQKFLVPLPECNRPGEAGVKFKSREGKKMAQGTYCAVLKEDDGYSWTNHRLVNVLMN